MKSIGELCELNPARADNLADDELVTFLPMSNVAEETGKIDASELRLFGELRRKSYRPFREGDVLFAKITPCMENGKCAVARNLRNGYGFGSTEFHVLRANGDVDEEYLRYFVAQPAFRYAAATSMTGTAGQLRVPTSFMRQAVIPVPPLAVQRRIVDVIEEQFSRLDAAEESLDCAAQRLRTLRGATLWELAEQPDAEWANIGEVAEVRGGIQKQPKRRPDKNPYPFLRVANVGRGTLDLNEVHQVELFSREIERYRLQSGDLLVVEGNGSADQIGRSALWHGEITNCVHQNHLIRVRPNSRIDPCFLEAFWNAPQTISLLSRLASSTSGLHTLSTAKIKSIRIPLLPIEIQKQLVAQLDRQLSIFEDTMSEIDHARRHSKQLRRAILERAFSGRLVSRSDGEGSVSSVSAILDADRATGARAKRNGGATSQPKSQVTA